jgi:hypothetical protein
MAPVAFPAGQSAVAELQIKPVLVKGQPAAADIAERQEDFVARAAAEVVQWCPQRLRGVFHAHPDRQRHVV